MSRERDPAPSLETKEREQSSRDLSPRGRRSRSPPRRYSKSGGDGRRSSRSPRRDYSPRRYSSRSPPRRRYSSRSRTPPPRRYSKSGGDDSPRRSSRSPPPRRGRSRSRSPPRRDYGRPNRDYGGRSNFGGQSGDYRGDWRRRGERPLAKPSNVLGVFGLAPETDKDELEVIFKKYGKLKEIVLVKDRASGLSKGFCFVYYEDEQDATDAKTELDGSTVEGRKIKVVYSLTTKPHEPTPGQYLGNKRWDRTRQGYSDSYKSGGEGYSDSRRSRSRSR